VPCSTLLAEEADEVFGGGGRLFFGEVVVAGECLVDLLGSEVG